PEGGVQVATIAGGLQQRLELVDVFCVEPDRQVNLWIDQVAGADDQDDVGAARALLGVVRLDGFDQPVDLGVVERGGRRRHCAPVDRQPNQVRLQRAEQ